MGTVSSRTRGDVKHINRLIQHLVFGDFDQCPVLDESRVERDECLILVIGVTRQMSFEQRQRLGTLCKRCAEVARFHLRGQTARRGQLRYVMPVNEHQLATVYAGKRRGLQCLGNAWI